MRRSCRPDDTEVSQWPPSAEQLTFRKIFPLAVAKAPAIPGVENEGSTGSSDGNSGMFVRKTQDCIRTWQRGAPEKLAELLGKGRALERGQAPPNAAYDLQIYGLVIGPPESTASTQPETFAPDSHGPRTADVGKLTAENSA